MSTLAIFKGKDGDRNLLLAIVVSGLAAAYFYKKTQSPEVVAGLPQFAPHR